MPTPTTPTFDPPGSSILVSPCTLNTLTKWAAAHSDNLAISLLCEALGREIPIRAEVSLSGPYGSLPQAKEATTRLEAMGVDLYRAHGATGPGFLPALDPDISDRLHELGASQSG